jgi:hypothetical protein
MGEDSQLTNDDLGERRGSSARRGNYSLEDLPCRARHASCGFNRATEDDELHAVDDGIAGDIADERLDETLKCLHCIKKGGSQVEGIGMVGGKKGKRM